MGAPRTVRHLVVLVAAAALTSCAGPPPVPAGLVGAGESSPTPEDLRACALPDGVDLPESCVAVDVEANMALNEGYRQRRPVTAEQAEAAEPERQAVEDALTGLVGTAWTGSAVADALVAEGIDRDRAHVVTVGDVDDPQQVEVVVVSEKTAVCILGEIDDDGVEAESEGTILDGGCVPAQ